LPPDQVYRFAEQYERTFRVLPLTPTVVLESVRGVRDHQLGYYDAQIWAAARLNQVSYVLSEDFNTGATLDGVTFLNPFAADFEVDGL
jgi:predicted nucleic acid-binding protein